MCGAERRRSVRVRRKSEGRSPSVRRGEGWEENVKTKEGKKKNMVGVSEPRGVG